MARPARAPGYIQASAGFGFLHTGGGTTTFSGMHGGWKISLAVATLSVVPTLSRAANAVPVESVTPASGLGAAREELNTLKGARQADEVRAGTGSVEMPKLHPTADPDPLPRRRNASGRPERREPGSRPGTNWLLEGMAREKALAEKSGRSPRAPRDVDRTSRAPEALAGESAADGEDDENPAGQFGLEEGDTREPGLAEALAEPPDSAEPPAPSETPVANPLADFLGDWLSPGDHDLLRSTMGSAESAAASREGYGAVALESANPVIAGMAPRGRFDAERRDGKPADNPFLAFLQSPETSVTGPGVNAPVPAPPSEPLAVPAQIEPPPTRSRTPDFVRPLRDEKYYKPLKRF